VNRLHLHIIRHAQSLANIGQADIPNAGLSELGIWQAAQIPSFFRSIQPKALYCSPLRRVIETATPLHLERGVPLTLIPEMAEIFNGAWLDYRDYAWESCQQIEDQFPYARFIDTHDPLLKWWPDWPESEKMVRQRVQRFVEHTIASYLGTKEHIVIFGHGHTVADLQALICPESAFPTHNAAIMSFELDAQGSCVSALFHTDHLGSKLTG
jgi:broad specificity phosphatase PhoE